MPGCSSVFYPVSFICKTVTLDLHCGTSEVMRPGPVRHKIERANCPCHLLLFWNPAPECAQHVKLLHSFKFYAVVLGMFSLSREPAFWFLGDGGSSGSPLCWELFHSDMFLPPFHTDLPVFLNLCSSLSLCSLESLGIRWCLFELADSSVFFFFLLLASPPCGYIWLLLP